MAARNCPLQFLSATTERLQDFRFYTLRGSVPGTGSFAGKFPRFKSVRILAVCCSCGFFALNTAKYPGYPQKIAKNPAEIPVFGKDYWIMM
jgi:hypothetical protein